eukprot:SAG31_NODE_6331_length_2062_cov_7.328069_2_plen_48_part_01
MILMDSLVWWQKLLILYCLLLKLRLQWLKVLETVLWIELIWLDRLNWL